jgi:hypothetical protein
MMKALLALLAAVIAVPILLVVLLIGPQVTQSRQAGSAVCVAMLGYPPTPEVTVARLSGPYAESIAEQAHPGTPLPVGESAYKFVTTLNTVTNWRTLVPQAVAAWAANPAKIPAPAGAIPEQPWSAAEFTEDQRELLAQNTPSAYDKACAVLLRRIEAETASATSASSQGSTAVADAQRTRIVELINARIGGTTTDYELWQLVSPTPQLDARRTALAQLTANPGPLTDAAPGDLLCYDFTTWGPTHCALITTAAPHTQIAVIAADGTLTTTTAPDNSTIIHPTSTGGMS